MVKKMELSAAAVVLVLAGDVMAQPAPVPLGVIRRPAYVEPPPPEPTLPRTGDWRPAVRWEHLARPRLRWAPLPPGTVACSFDPAGREVCGAGYWFAEAEDRERR